MLRALGRNLLSALFLVSSAVGAESAPEPSTSPWVWSDVSRIVAIGDVHGSYDELISLLRALDLVDADLAWTGGEQHLVMVGDLLDRGAGDRAVLDLMMRLEPEAEAAGGRVHVVLGNHEVMNLERDMRYVAPETYRDFIEFETPHDRNVYKKQFLAQHFRPGVTQEKLSEAFHNSFPEGYFGRLRAFDADGPYGAWLLELPTVIRINGFLFVHGGLVEEVAALGIDEINRQVSASLRIYLAARERLEAELDVPADSDEIVALAERLQGRNGNPERATAARNLLQQADALTGRADGPFWYRGLSVENERLARDALERTLKSVGARAMVIGHTPTSSGQITSRFQGRVYRTDVGMVYGRQPAALVLDASGVRVFDPQSLEYRPPLTEAPQGEGWARKYEELPDARLEKFLARADISGCTSLRIEDRSCEVCEVKRRGLQLRAVFLIDDEAPEPFPGGTIARRYVHELAAYKLDRMLGLEFVPVTVLRKKEGVEGALRIWVEPALDLEWIRSQQRWDLLEGLETRIGEAGLLNALLGSDERLDIAKMLIPVERRILFGDHSRSFPLSGRLPSIFPLEACDALDARFELALRTLEPGSLETEMKGLLSAAQITSLLERRDAVLDTCRGGAQ